MKIRNVATVLALAVAAVSLPAAAQSCFDPGYVPPDPLVESPPPSPGEGYLWSPGYWGCEGEGPAWVGGGWIQDRPGYRWEPHHWENGGDNHWNLHQGQWHADSHIGHEGGGHEGGGHEGGGEGGGHGGGGGHGR